MLLEERAGLLGTLSTLRAARIADQVCLYVCECLT